MDAPLEIPFPIPDPKVELTEERNEEYYEAVEKRYDFWQSTPTVEWFHAHGYNLYRRRPFDDHYFGVNQWAPLTPSAPFVQADFPFPHHDNHPTGSPALDRLARGSAGTILYGQDSQGHHVVLKLVHSQSDELRIYELLHRQSWDTTKANCVLPVLEIIPIKEFSIVAMPRWGTGVGLPDLTTVGEAVKLMHDLLKSLAFLHSHKIVHRDISFMNIVVNHFCSVDHQPNSPFRCELRRTGVISYALIDYNLSLIAPEDTNISDFREPAEYSFLGRYPKPHDTSQAEVDYNPFAFDVGTMGVLFCEEFQYFCKELPFLAPLLDGMTTRNVSRRFTAAGALEFLEARLEELPSHELSKPIKDDPSLWATYEEYDRWTHVPIHYLRLWSAYREPPIPLTTRCMRRVCTFTYLRRAVYRLRWIWLTLFR